MANQTLQNNSSSPSAFAWEKYLITADHLIENPKEIKNGWNYRRIETFLKFIVANSNIEPDFDLEKASLQEVVNFLRSHSDIFSEAEEHLESVVPSPELLKQLLEDWEEAQTKFNQERAANKLIETIEKISLTKKYQQIIRERLNQAVPPLIAEAIVKELPVDSQPALALKKSEELPEAQRESAVKEIVTQTQETISIAIANLEQKIEIPPKERASLSKIQVTISDLPKIASDLSKPPAERKEIEKWLETQFSVEESQNLAKILAPAVATKIDFIRVSEKQIEEAVIVSLAENAPELGIIPREKISKIIAAFIPDKQDLKLLSLVKETIPPVVLDKPPEVTSLPSKFPRFFASPLQRSSPKDSLHVQGSKGKSFIEQLRQRIFTEGIDKSNALQLRSIVLESWILYLTAQNISQEDLDYTIQRLIKSGENPNSLRIRELRELREALISFQTNLPPQKLLEIKETGKKLGQQGSFPVNLNSRSRTVILREEVFNPKYNLKTRFNAFVNRLLGKKTVVLDSGPTVVINRLSLFTHRISEGFKTLFFQTGFGQNLKSWLQISTKKGLQGIWDLAKAGGGKIITGGFKPIFGLGIKKGLSIIGEAGAMALSGGLSKVFTLGKGFIKGISSGFGIFKTILGGVSGESSEIENNLIKQILLVVIGIFILIPILFFLINTTTSTAFIEPTEIFLYQNIDPFNVSKTVTPAKIDNSLLPTSFAYTVSITAKEKKLTNIKLSENFIYIKSGSVTNFTPSLNPPLPSSLPDILPGETKTITFQINLPNGFEDSLVLNTLSVEANIQDDPNPKTVKASASINIGNAIGCFAFEEPWPETDRGYALTAIAKILSSGKYANSLCQNPPQSIVLVRELANYGYCWVDDKIHITDRCTGGEQVTFYSLSHETGHFYAIRNNNIYSQFLQEMYDGFYVPLESPLCSYPRLSELTPEQVPGEDFPETIALYLTNQYFPNYYYHNCNKAINLQNDYPKHYNFVKNNIF